MKQYQATSLFIADKMTNRDYMRMYGQSLPENHVEDGFRVELFGGFSVWLPVWTFELNFSEVEENIFEAEESMGLPPEIMEETSEIHGVVVVEEQPKKKKSRVGSRQTSV